MKKTKQQKPRPELSIGIIFKNNIRSLERCLQALAPLREKILCQLVMADTGSTDGSRTVAERYADVLFDFPWINDFSAARNAVMDRCVGRWYISVDSDEYLDEDWNELFLFLTSGQSRQKDVKAVSVVIRNYTNYEMDGPYSDFYAIRMIRMSAGFRYEGAIHEKLTTHDTSLLILNNTVFHHDGYVGLNTEAGREKRERNITALREKLKKSEDLLTLLQFIESGTGEADFEEKLRFTVKKVEEQAETYQVFGPPILRHAVVFAKNRGLPELEDWTALAKNMFPNSYFTRIDVAYTELGYHFDKGEYAFCMEQSEQCLEAYADYRAGRGDMAGQMYSTLTYPSFQCEQSVRILAASSYLNNDQAEQGCAHLSELAFDQLTEEQTENFVKLIRFSYCTSHLDGSPLVLEAWNGISASPKKQAEQNKKAFIQEASKAFRPDVQEEEQKRPNFVRFSCGVFQSLAGQCEIGTAAAILEAEDPERISELLGTVRIWRQLPVMALSHALRLGVSFPPSGAELKLEQMDGLAKRLAENEKELLELIRFVGKPNGLSSLCWTRAMVFAAMRIHEWEGGEKDAALARTFAEVERAFLPVCYSQEALCPENLFLLPPTHRLGWYCDKAFAALDSGDSAGYIRYLHGGLDAYEGMREMIESLLAEFEQRQRAVATPELLALAEQVRTMLAAYDPEDPAVVALKASPVYQKVSYLIEGGPV